MQNKKENIEAKKKWRRNCVRGWFYWIKKEDKKEVELYVLLYMLVTAATFHLDRSPLNTEARSNAEGVNTVVNVKQKRKQKRSKEKETKKMC